MWRMVVSGGGQKITNDLQKTLYGRIKPTTQRQNKLVTSNYTK